MAAVSPPAASVQAPVIAADMPAAIAPWLSYIDQAAQRFGVPAAWIVAVMQAESRGRTHLNGRQITSRAGAMGLMQLMPATYQEMARMHGLGADPFDPRDNILAGTAYLAQMRDRFGYPGLFAAYNAGPARYQAHLDTGAPLPAETRAYIATLAASPGQAAMPPAVLSGTRLFFRLDGQGPSAPPPAGLFAPRSELKDEGA
ncbi:MAG: lytic transglycosylase domain-containing protein [Caulobacter sp.]